MSRNVPPRPWPLLDMEDFRALLTAGSLDLVGAMNVLNLMEMIVLM